MKTRRKTTKPPAKAQGGNGRALRVSRLTRVRKSRWMPGELERFREVLLCKRRELLGDAATLCNEALRAGNQNGSGASHLMPSHMAELASDAWEQEFTLILMEDKQALLREIEDALERIGSDTYGICEGTGRVIPKARLRAIPWARYRVEYARSQEAKPA